MLLIEGEQEACLQPPTEPPMGQASTATSAAAPLHPCTPSHHTPQAPTHCLISSCPLFCPAAPATWHNPSPKGPHCAKPTHPSAGTSGDCPPIPGRHSLTLSFWKEWRKLPPSSPSSLGVPGGLLMPLMLFGEFCGKWRGGGERVPTTPQNATGAGQCCGHIPCVPIHQGHSSTPVLREGQSPHTHPATNPTYFWKSIYVS